MQQVTWRSVMGKETEVSHRDQAVEKKETLCYAEY